MARSSGRRLQGAALDLIALHGIEERLEIAFAETFVALALDNFEEDRADQGRGKDLQQQTATYGMLRAAAALGLAVGKDRAFHLFHRLAVAGQPLLQHLVVGAGGFEEVPRSLIATTVA